MVLAALPGPTRSPDRGTRLRAALAVAVGFTARGFPPGACWASGFAVPELSAAGLGRANAIVADPQDPGAFAYNPAAMAFHDRSSLSFGALLARPDFRLTTASGEHDSEGATWLGAPLVQANWVAAPRWRVGLFVNTPFGLETRWPFATFPALSAPIPLAPGVDLPPGLDHPSQTKLDVLAASASLAYRLSDGWSLAGGVDYYYAREATLDTYATALNGDGDGWGWHLAALYAVGPWSAGLAYRASATLDLEGRATTADPILIALGTPPSQAATLDLALPWRLQLGVRYAVSDRLAVELDWSRTGWSAFDPIRVRAASGAVIRSDTNDWDDSDAYRVGLSYQLRPATQVRVGYAFDRTGQEDGHFSARVPGSDRHLFSLGLSQQLSAGWTLDAGYTYVRLDDRRFRGGDRPYQPGAELNGTAAFDGDYAWDAHLLALELRKTF